MLSVIMGLLGVLGMTGVVLSLRAIGERAHIIHSVVASSSHCVLFPTLCMILFNVPLVIPTRTLEVFLLFLHAVFCVLAQVLLAIGLQYETAGRASLGLYTSIIFALIFEFTFFHTTPSPLSIVGTLMTLSAAIYTTLTKAVIKPATDSSPVIGPQ